MIFTCMLWLKMTLKMIKINKADKDNDTSTPFITLEFEIRISYKSVI